MNFNKADLIFLQRLRENIEHDLIRVRSMHPNLVCNLQGDLEAARFSADSAVVRMLEEVESG